MTQGVSDGLSHLGEHPSRMVAKKKMSVVLITLTGS